MRSLSLGLKKLKKKQEHKQDRLDLLRRAYPEFSEMNDDDLLQYFVNLSDDEVSTKMMSQGDVSTSTKVTYGCRCTDGSGSPKSLFETAAQAQKIASIYESNSNQRYKLYPCPTGMGWHLTSI